MWSIRHLIARRRRYEDISLSIQEHIAERADELEQEGMPRSEAERKARREFGNVPLFEERSREIWQWTWLESLLADLKFSLRRLRKSPGFTATILLTLSIGIGATTAVFSVVNSVLLRPLPYPNSDRLLALRLNTAGGGLTAFSDSLRLSPSMYFTFVRHNQTFQSIGIWTTRDANVTGLARPEQVRTALISDGVLQSLNVSPAVGRWFSPVEQTPRSTMAVLLSYGYWQRKFGGDRSVIGRTVQVDSQNREIVGIMPQGFRVVDQDFDLLIPLALDPVHQNLFPFGYDGVGLLRPGVTIAQANADIARLIPVWMDSWSNGPGSNSHYYEVWRITPNFLALKQQVIGNIGSALWVVMATVGLVMLIVCTNVANLLLVRAESRNQELTIRSALGAGRARIARELLVESLVFGLTGGLFAVGVAYGALRLLVAIGPENLPRLSEITLDARSLAFTLLLSVLSSLFFGSIPVFKHARAKVSIHQNSMSRKASKGRTHRRSGNALVVTQVAIALVLMVSALLMIRTFFAMRNIEPGFADAEHLETLRIFIPELLKPNPREVAQSQKEISDKIATLPGVNSVGFAAAIPLDGNDPNWDVIEVEHKHYGETEPPLRLYNYVSPGYFHTLGTRFLAGRDFTWTDLYQLRSQIIVSQSFARESWGSAAAAIGKRVRKYSSSPWQEIIGVVEDVRVHGVEQPAPAIIYWPSMFYDRFDHEPIMNGLRSVTYVVHSSRASSEAFLKQLQQAVWSVEPSLPLASVETMQQLRAQSMARTSFTLVMLAIAGTMAMILSLIGLYGVIAYSVSQRTQEIGIRLALGARKGLLRWMFVRSALALATTGIILGLAVAAGLSRLMSALLFGISALDPVTFSVVPFILALAAALASYLPAYHAATINPVEALKAE